MAVAENGIFEVAKNKYSKCYCFQDINYTTTNEDEQIDIAQTYGETVVNMSTYTDNYVNPLAMDVWNLDHAKFCSKRLVK